MDTQQQETNTHPSEAQNPVRTYVIGAIVIAVIAAGLWWFLVGSSDSQNQLTTNENLVTDTNYPDVVARVNGEEVSNDEFAASIAQISQNAQAQGMDPNSTEVKSQIETQALDTLVNTKLLLQVSQEAGITVTDEDVDARIAVLEEQFGGAEGLQTQLDAAEIDMETLRNDVHQQLLIDAYIAANTDTESITVTDEEVATFYQSLSSEGQEIPPLEGEIETQLKQQLILQKQQLAVSELIEKLRADADIEVLI